MSASLETVFRRFCWCTVHVLTLQTRAAEFENCPGTHRQFVDGRRRGRGVSLAFARTMITSNQSIRELARKAFQGKHPGKSPRIELPCGVREDLYPAMLRSQQPAFFGNVPRRRQVVNSAPQSLRLAYEKRIAKSPLTRKASPK